MINARTLDTRTERVAEYDNYKAAMRRLRTSKDPRDQRAFKEERDKVVAAATRSLEAGEIDRIIEARLHPEQTRDVSSSDVHASTFMSNMAIKYANEELISDELIPMVPVEHLSDQYPIYSKRDMLAVPDDSMKGRSSPNEVFDTITPGNYVCEARGLKKQLEKKTVDNQDQIFDRMLNLTEQVSRDIAFAREKRGMTLLTTTGSYGSNTAAVAVGDRWDTNSGGDPITLIRTVKEEVWRGNADSSLIGFCPLSVYIKLSTNPVVLDVLKYTSGGIPPRAILAALLELDDIMVAKAWEDTANEGQTQSIARMVTTNCFGIVRVAKAPSKDNVSFAYNFRFKGQINNLSWYKAEDGTRGTYWHQQTVDEKQSIVAADAAYLLRTVIGS